eukprot:6166065-Pyramimonas_sp.AAC.1
MEIRLASLKSGMNGVQQLPACTSSSPTMTRVIWSMRCGGCGWTERQRPRMRAGAVAMTGAAMPMPHQPRNTT